MSQEEDLRTRLEQLHERIGELEREANKAEMQRQAFIQVRDAIWQMRSSADLDPLLQAVWRALTMLDISFTFCGVNLIDANGHPAIVVHNMTAADGELHTYKYENMADQPLVQIWQQQGVVYRADLEKDDPYAESYMRDYGIRSLVDLPFSHGTLAVSSDQANPFSKDDLDVMQYLASALSGGFRRIEDLRNLEAHNQALEEEINERRLAEAAVTVSLAVQRVRNKSLRMESEADWLSVVAACRHELSQFISFDDFGINIVDLQRGTHYAHYADGDGSTHTGAVASEVPDALRQALEQNALAYRRNRQEMERLNDATSLDCHSIIDVPFNGGTLAVNSMRENAFSANDIEILEQFARVIDEANRRLLDLQQLNRREEQLHQAQKMEAIGQLTAGIAHNFNNMLQGVMGNLFLARQEATTDSQRELLNSADVSAHRAALMVHQLLLFTRPGAQRHVEELDPTALTTDVIDMSRRTFDRRIELTFETEANLPTIQGDRTQFEQIVLNVLINARDAVADLQDRAPKIHVQLTLSHGEELGPNSTLRYVRIRTTDNGAGMDAETCKRIFEPFFTTKAVDKGTGLGLSTIYSIIQRQNGQITCESTPGEGAIFTVYLPVPEPEVETLVDKAPKLMSRSSTILIIDDEDTVRQSTARILEHHGYRTHVASDGIEGLELFRQEQPDLVLLDLSMPRMSGREVLREIQRINPQAKVLLFTGYSTDEDEFGPSIKVLQKPFMAADLAAAIAAAL